VQASRRAHRRHLAGPQPAACRRPRLAIPSLGDHSNAGRALQDATSSRKQANRGMNRTPPQKTPPKALERWRVTSETLHIRWDDPCKTWCRIWPKRQGVESPTAKPRTGHRRTHLRTRPPPGRSSAASAALPGNPRTNWPSYRSEDPKVIATGGGRLGTILYCSIIQTVQRLSAVEDIEVDGGVSTRAGDILDSAPANWDARQFPNPTPGIARQD